MDNTEDKITKLLSDPENLKVIAKLASGFMGTSDSTAPSIEIPSDIPETSSGETVTESIPAELSEESMISDTAPSSPEGSPLGALGDILSGADLDKSIGLLGALKPYLGSHKKATCDSIIKLLGAAKLFGASGFKF